MVDAAKGIGIVLVVFGHALRGVDDLASAPAGLVEAMDEWIYSFHMPLFFLLSGLFVESSIRRPMSNVAHNRVMTIVYPYFLWSIAQETIRAMSGARPNGFDGLWTILYEPVMQFWFLYVLLIVSIGYVAMRKLGLPVLGVMAVAAALYLTMLVQLDLGAWSVPYMVRSNAIYFVLGAWASTTSATARFEGLTLPAARRASLGGFGALTTATALGLATNRWLDLPLALLGSAAAIALARGLAPVSTVLASWGRSSFEIFVAHTIFSATTRTILSRVFSVDDFTVHLVIGFVVGMAGPLALAAAARRLDAPWIFRGPGPGTRLRPARRGPARKTLPRQAT